MSRFGHIEPSVGAGEDGEDLHVVENEEAGMGRVSELAPYLRIVMSGMISMNPTGRWVR